jgi:serine/threonine protein kinase
MSAALSEPDLELAIRDRLYGGPRDVTATPLRVTSRRLGARYRLLEPIGVGGMADVHRALDERLKRDVAVKVIASWLVDDAPSLRRFRREAELAARLSHPNVVTVLDAGSRPREYLVMELVDGIDLGKLLKRGARLDARPGPSACSSRSAMRWSTPTGAESSMATCPRAIVLIRRFDDAALLADFGLAADTSGAGNEASVMGTPGYVAPETLKGAAPAPSSDVYSVAALAHRLLAGRPPGSHAPLDATRPLVAAVQRALADDPADRPRSPAELRDELVAAGGRGALVRAA